MYGLIEKLSRRDALTPEEAAALREVLGSLRRVAAGTDIVREARGRSTALCSPAASRLAIRPSRMADGRSPN